MKMNKILTLALLFTVIYSLGTYTNQIGVELSTTPTLFRHKNGYIPIYKLGFIAATTELTVQVKVNRTTVPSPLTTMTLGLIDSTGVAVPGPVTTINPDPTIIQLKFTIVTDGYYKFSLDTTLTTHINIVYITALVNVGGTITKIFDNYVDILRTLAYKVVYVRKDTSVKVKLNLTNIGVLVVADVDLYYGQISTSDVTNTTFTTAPALIPTADLILTSEVIGTTTLYHIVHTRTLTTGYHVFGFGDISLAPTVILNEDDIVLFSVQSDTYPCPFPATMTDYHHTFPACIPRVTTAANAAFPCINVTNSTCVECYSGYVLVGSSCVYNPCSSNQYYLNLTCVNASFTCLTFDRFTGLCLTCANGNYTNTNGACNVNACPAGHTNRNNTCVNNYCNAFVPITGVCNSCISSAFELIDGSCAPTRCLTANLYFSNQYQGCIPYPAFCSSIDFVTEKCKACLSPYTLNAATLVCELICVAPQVKWSNQCVNLPENCLAIDINRHCSTCKANFTRIAGRCEPTGVIIINNP